MKLFFFLLRYSKRLVALALLAGIISGASSTGLLALINSALRNNGRATTLVWSFVGLCILVPLARIASETLLASLGQGALYDLRLQLSKQILSVPLRRLEELGAHRLLTALTDDVPTITNMVTLIPLLCINAAMVIGSLIYLGRLSWTVLLGVLAFMALGIATYQLPVIKSLRFFALARKDGDALFENFRALTGGIKELKLHLMRRKAFMENKLEPTARSFRRNTLVAMGIYTVASSWGQLLVFVVIGLVIFGLPNLGPVDTHLLTGYVLALLFITTPLQVIMNSVPGLGRASVALNNIKELGLTLAASSTECDSNFQSEPAESWRSIEMMGAVHTYKRDGEDGHFVTGPINLAFRPGELIFLTGGNGSGKTTMAKMLTGLYAPEEGEILWNGKPVTDEMRESYREHFSVVFSDFYVFDALLGLDAPELDEKAREYLVQLHLDSKIKISNGSLSTTELSQGQRKRLALLTAYLEDRPIYLFDEWAADQDPMFKEIFYYQILPELKNRGKAVIVISHDDRYYHVGDRIIKLDSGKIVSDQTGPFSAPRSSTMAIST
jgi:putative pyoverdin transport system ATP-binding/permease protein